MKILKILFLWHLIALVGCVSSNDSQPRQGGVIRNERGPGEGDLFELDLEVYDFVLNLENIRIGMPMQDVIVLLGEPNFKRNFEDESFVSYGFPVPSHKNIFSNIQENLIIRLRFENDKLATGRYIILQGEMIWAGDSE